MDKFLEIFDKRAKENMIQWSLRSFMDSHPKLLKSIRQSLIDASKLKKEIKITKKESYNPEELSEIIGNFGNFLRDNYYGVGAPKLMSYNPQKYPHGTVEQIKEFWIENCLNKEP